MHILVLDDNPDDRELVKREISAVFPDATFREDGTDWASFEAALGDVFSYDLVTTDHALRWTTGIEILNRVKALRPELPVIMFTGTGNEEVAVEAMKAGLDDYVVKSPRHFARFRASARAVVGHAGPGPRCARGRRSWARRCGRRSCCCGSCTTGSRTTSRPPWRCCGCAPAAATMRCGGI